MILSSIIFQGLIFAKIAQEIRCKDPKSIQKNRIYMAGEMLWDFIRFFSLSENYSQTTHHVVKPKDQNRMTEVKKNVKGLGHYSGVGQLQHNKHTENE